MAGGKTKGSKSSGQGEPVLEHELDQEPAPGSRLAFVSLGCPKNTVDSERMLGKLVMAGHQIVSDASDADVVVVNTCGFIEPARLESLGVLRELVKLKENGQLRAVVAAGCLAERDKGSLFDQVPGLDQVVGVHGREEITSAVSLSLERVKSAVSKRKRVDRRATNSFPSGPGQGPGRHSSLAGHPKALCIFKNLRRL